MRAAETGGGANDARGHYSDWLGPAAMILIALTGGVAWIIDQRRIHELDDG